MASSSSASTPMRSQTNSYQGSPAVLSTPHTHRSYHVIQVTSERSGRDALPYHMSHDHGRREARRLHALDTSGSFPRSFSRDETFGRGHKAGKKAEHDRSTTRADTVPREVAAVQHLPPAAPFSGSSAPLYATSKTSFGPFFPIKAWMPPRSTGFSAVEESEVAATPEDLVMYRLLTICWECNIHSRQLVESAMKDVAQHITSHAVSGDLDDIDDLLNKWTSHMSVQDAVMRVMKTHLPRVNLCIDSCRVLAHFGKLSFALSPLQCTSSMAVVQIVLECLEHHSSDAKLVHEALDALIHMGAHFPYHESLFGIETFRFLVESVLRRHIENSEVQVDVLFLLGNLSCNLALAPVLVEADGLPALLESMNFHWQDAKVNEGGALALFKLCKWSRARKHLVLEHGGYATVFRATKVHPDGRVGLVARATLELLS